MTSKFKAVIFDMGGVMVRLKSPEKLYELFEQIQANPDQMSRLMACELGEITLSEASSLFESTYPNIVQIKNYESLNVGLYLGSLDTIVYQAAKYLQKKGLKVGILSNNFYLSEEKKRTFSISEIYEFDVTIESCRVGLRKPDRKIYELMLSKLELQPDECIFVDDMKSNVLGAEKLGMTGIHDGDSNVAVARLECLLGIDLR